MLVGTIVNTITVITGSLLGMLLGEKVLPERLRDTVMKGLGLCTLYIGLTGLSGSSNALIPIISMVVGAILGELLDLDGRLNRFAQKLENRFQKEGDGRPSLAEGFVTSSLVFCVGSMTVMGALQDGLTGNHDLLFTKSILDLVSSTIFASSLGIGVLLAAVTVFIVQGGIATVAHFLAPFLVDVSTSEPSAALTEMLIVGSILIVALGLNLLGITRLKVMNYVLALFVPILLCTFM